MKRMITISAMVVLSTLLTTLQAATDYNISVGGVAVTSSNASNITGSSIKSGTVKYDASSNTLTLTNAFINCTGTATEGAIASKCPDLTITFIGSCTISNEGFAGIEVMNEVSTTIVGAEGNSLEITGHNFGIYVGPRSTLKCGNDNGTVGGRIVAKGQRGIGSNNSGQFDETVWFYSGTTVNAISTSSSYAAIERMASISRGTGVNFISPKNVQIETGNYGQYVCDNNKNVVTDLTIGVIDYGIKVGGVSVTSCNKSSIAGGNIKSGKIYFTPSSNGGGELTLESAEIGKTSTLRSAIENNNCPGLVVTFSKNTGKLYASSGYSAINLSHNTTIKGSVTTESGVGIALGKDVELTLYQTDMTIKAERDGIRSGHADGNGTSLILDKVKYLAVESQSTAAITTIGNCTMTGCDIAEPIQGWYSRKSLAFVEGLYKGSSEKSKVVVIRPIGKSYDLKVNGITINDIRYYYVNEEDDSQFFYAGKTDNNGNLKYGYITFDNNVNITCRNHPFIESGIDSLSIIMAGQVKTYNHPVFRLYNGCGVKITKPSEKNDYAASFECQGDYAVYSTQSAEGNEKFSNSAPTGFNFEVEATIPHLTFISDKGVFGGTVPTNLTLREGYGYVGQHAQYDFTEDASALVNMMTGETVKRLEIDHVTDYDVTVAGFKINNTNADDILGDGTMRYQRNGETATLTLKNVNATFPNNTDIIDAVNGTLTVLLTGENIINNCSLIYKTGELVFKSADDSQSTLSSLTINKCELLAENITIWNSQVTASGAQTATIQGKKVNDPKFTVKHTCGPDKETLLVIGGPDNRNYFSHGTAPIKGFQKVYLEGVSLIEPDDASYDENECCYVDANGEMIVDTKLVFSSNVPGDINGNQEVDYDDISGMVGYIMKSQNPSKADVNGDGKVNIADVVKLIKKIQDKGKQQ